MNNFCPSCGTQNEGGRAFCSNCGAQLGNVNPNQTNNVNQQFNQSASQGVDPQAESYKSTALTMGILSIFLGLIFSIIGLVYGSKYKKSTGNSCAGYIISMITLILQCIGIVITIIVFCFAFNTVKEEIRKDDLEYKYSSYDDTSYDEGFNYYTSSWNSFDWNSFNID